jgi:Uma2 family endonuclease
MEQVQKLSRQEQRLCMSYEEFLARYTDVHAEWVNGEVIVFMPPGTRHQSIAWFLSTLLGIFVRRFRLGIVLFAPYEMRLVEQGSAREPDIVYVTNEHAARLTGNRLLGPADLVIEITSPESITRDRVEKFDESQDAGIREYWLIDARANRERADFWVLDENGRYQPVQIGKDGIYRSTVVPNFWFNVDWLWESEMPDPLDAFAEIIDSDDLADALRRLGH